jgi:hypothetical protein
VDEPPALEFEWIDQDWRQPSIVRILLADTAGGRQVTVTELGLAAVSDDPAVFGEHRQGWEMHLSDLAIPGRAGVQISARGCRRRTSSSPRRTACMLTRVQVVEVPTRELQVLVRDTTIAREGSFGRAARELRVRRTP